MESVESGLEVDVTPKSFSMMNRLRYLKIKNGNLPKGLEYLPNSLRILDWMGYPAKFLPSHFNPQKLFELRLCHSCIKHVQIGNEVYYNCYFNLLLLAIIVEYITEANFYYAFYMTCRLYII